MKNKFGVIGFLIVTLVPNVSAITYSDNFIGLSTDLAAKIEAGDLSQSSILRISQVFTYGPDSTAPFRFRLGVGWYVDQPLAVAAGIELPLLERLSARKTRSLGLYLVGDCGIAIAHGVAVEARGWLYGVVPITPLGGLAFGIGLDSANGPILGIGYWSGVYPLLVK